MTARFALFTMLLALAGCGDGTGSDGGTGGDAGAGLDAASGDGGGGQDAGSPTDGGGGDDAGPDLDAGPGFDAGGDPDAGGSTDAGSGSDAGGTDAGGTDAGSGTDAGGTDAGGTDAGGTDAGSGRDAGDTDAGVPCGARVSGYCADGALMCLSCPFGGPLENHLCTTPCAVDADCTDPARPICNRPMGPGPGGMGICTDAAFICRWGAICASPDTPVLTPSGERPIAELEVGDLVYTMHEGQLVARPLVRVHRTPVVEHAVVRAVLASGRVLEISGPHPTADGRRFDDLAPGDSLDGVLVELVETIPYAHAHTHDVLPDSDTGTYVAAGVLVGSTLAP